MKTIDASTFRNNDQYRQRVIDVRSPAEYRARHVPGSENLPLDRLQAGELPALREGETLTLVCETGKRSGIACELLMTRLPGQIVTVEGGIAALANAGVELRGEGGVWSLERQVRLVAGALVLAGSALSLWLPGFLTVPLFVGAGLVFAGVTDTCGMAILLARLPWNR